jgi:hypothetical protein
MQVVLHDVGSEIITPASEIRRRRRRRRRRRKM